MLASVRDAAEARLGVQAGVDVIDVKEPERGPLGAADPAIIAEVARRVAGRAMVSATTETAPTAPGLRAGLLATAACGVDVVKVGLFEQADAARLVAAGARLGPARCDAGAADSTVFAVVMADRWLPGAECLRALADAGVRGVMLDTADKAAGALPELRDLPTLSRFIAQCRASALECGLAGRLRLRDVAPLVALEPDYLGFRSALCAASQRAGQLDPERLRRVRRAIEQAGRL